MPRHRRAPKTQRPARSATATATATERRTIAITRLSAAGEGVSADGTVRVPFTLPGEVVAAEIGAGRGRLLELRVASDDRVVPPCVHFGACGGCALQHRAETRNAEWKRGRVAAELARAGIGVTVEATRSAPVASRRRVTLTAERGRDGHLVLGYHAARSHTLIDITTCPILAPPLQRRLGLLRALAALLLTHPGRVRLRVLLAANGLDVALLEPLDPSSLPLTRIAAQCSAASVIRLTSGHELLFQAEAPLVRIDGVTVAPAPGAFLQASREGERLLTEIVTAGCRGADRVADLFSGLGTFTLPLARTATVHAVEGDAAALAALAQAAGQAKARRSITTERRDLFADPLGAAELSPFDAVVFDPPRAGAQAQAEVLAQSAVPRIVAVSCNPATLARDLATLTAGGYTIVSVTPIDQFVFSSHIEVAAVLHRRT